MPDDREELTEYPPLPGSDEYQVQEEAKKLAQQKAGAQQPQAARQAHEAELSKVDEPSGELPPVPPPRGAPLHLAMVLATVRDPAQRQLLLDTYAEMGPGLSQELFGQVGAYLSAILDHQLARTADHADELASIAGQLRQTLEEYGEATLLWKSKGKEATANQPTAETMPDFGAGMEYLDAIRQIVVRETNRAVAAASATNVRNLKIACGACFLAGIVACAFFIHFF